LCSVGGDIHHTLILYEFPLLPESSSSSSSIDFKRFAIKTHARAHAAAVSCCAWPPAALGSSFVTCGDKHVKLWEVLLLLLLLPPLLLLLLLLLPLLLLLLLLPLLLLQKFHVSRHRPLPPAD
jgi:hypothetical protein